MTTINRRQILASLGLLGGSALLPGCGGHAEGTQSDNSPPDTAPGPSPQWQYRPLDPQQVAERAYEIYPEGGCMFALVGSVILTLADEVGEPFSRFPLVMMRYGEGGLSGWGTLCGIVNGGAALVGLFHSEKDKETRQQLITEFCRWYEDTPLPEFEPTEPQWAEEAVPCVARSVLCHVSTTAWCRAAGCSAFSMEKKERCRRLTADGARRIVEILNRSHQKGLPEFTPSEETRTCNACHGNRARRDAMVEMECQSCHQLPADHPAEIGLSE